MTRRIALAACLVVGSLGLESCAPVVPDAVANGIAASFADMPQPPTVSPARLARRVHVSASGDDWLIDYGRTGDFLWCGTGGCTHELYVAQDSGYRLVFSEQVREWRLTPGTPAGLDIEIHGSNCGLSGVEECRRRYVWDEADGVWSERPNGAGDGVLVGPLFQPVAPRPATYPQVVLDEADRRLTRCRDAGGAIDDGEYLAVSSPDLNADGRRDWIIGSAYSACHDAAGVALPIGGIGTSVVVSGDTGWVVALRLGDADYAVDVSTTPARFGIRTGSACLDGPACPVRWYRWTGAGLSLD